jgi:carboxyl-terminal processing protease
MSASASEIFAGALKDYRRVVVVGGDSTFGKGSVQSFLELPNNWGAVKVTTGLYYIPGGQSTQQQGVAADVVVPSLMNSDEIGEKNLPNSLPPNKIPSFLSAKANINGGGKPSDRFRPIEASWISELQSRSKVRVSKNPKFKEVLDELAKAEKNRGIIKLAEVRAAAEKNKKKEQEEKNKKRKEKIDDLDAPYISEAVDVLADLVELQSK